MAIAAFLTRMSVEEYLRTGFEPDAEFIDGVIEERIPAEWDHARLHGLLGYLLGNSEDEWDVYVLLSLRIWISPTRIRVSDVCVIDRRNEIEQIPTKPPLLCVEVKAPEERLLSMFDRIKDFHRMGVGSVWVFDPETQKVWVSTADGVVEWGGGVLTVAGTRIELDPAVAFERMMRRR